MYTPLSGNIIQKRWLLGQYDSTVVCISKSQWCDLWSKWPNFDLLFYNIKMSPCSGPLGSTLTLTGALEWGTVWTSTSTGAGIMKGQS